MAHSKVYHMNRIRVCQLVPIDMITYRIQIETMSTIFFLKKEYLTLPQCRKAINMINFAKFGFCIISIYKFVDDDRKELIDTIIK